jgi:hypothetical protein
MEKLKIVNEILKPRNLKEFDHQLEFLSNEENYNEGKPLVLGAGTSSGKTEMILCWNEIFFLKSENSKKKVLYIPATKTILRDNVDERIRDFNPSFSYLTITQDITKISEDNYVVVRQGKKNSEIEKEISKKNPQVIICLPITFMNNLEFIKEVDVLILDEAQEWYLAKTVQNIIEKLNPKIQILLTGTPFKFNGNEEKYRYFYVPPMRLLNDGIISNPQIQMISSPLKFKKSDFISEYDSLKRHVEKSLQENTLSLESVCRDMINKIKNKKGVKWGDRILRFNIDKLTSNYYSIFLSLDKTIIACHSIKQAEDFYYSLSSFNDLKGKVLVSNSKNDANSSNFERFKKDDSVKILIVVSRGRIGFNMGDLYNIVDFTYTRNIELLVQMIGRIFRLPSKNKDKQKIYYKVAPSQDVLYYESIMSATIGVLHEEFFSKYNGKNTDEIRIPVLRKKRNEKGDITNSDKQNKGNVAPRESFDNIGFPIDLKFFEKCLHFDDDNFSAVSFTTLKDVRDEINGYVSRKKRNIDYANEKLIKKILGDNNIKTRQECQKYDKALYCGICDSGLANKLLPDTGYKKTNPENIEDVKEYMDVHSIKTKGDFSAKNQGLYNKIKENGILDKLIPDRSTKPWDDSSIKKYLQENNIKTAEQLRKVKKSLYNKMREKNIFEEFDIEEKKDEWFVTSSEEQIKKYLKDKEIKQRTELRRETPEFYNFLNRNKKLDFFLPVIRFDTKKSDEDLLKDFHSAGIFSKNDLYLRYRYIFNILKKQRCEEIFKQ